MIFGLKLKLRLSRAVSVKLTMSSKKEYVGQALSHLFVQYLLDVNDALVLELSLRIGNLAT